MSAPTSIHLYIDWDGTITTHDTMSLVGSIAYSKGVSSDIPPWSHFADSYMADYTAHASSYKPPKHERLTLDQELEWLESLVSVDRLSASRVENVGLFSGVTTKDIHDSAREVAREVTSCAPSGQNIEDEAGRKIGTIAGAGTQLGAMIGSGSGAAASPNVEKGGSSRPRLAFRKGLPELLEKVEKAGGDTAVLSVNWSGCFIGSILRHALGKDVVGSVTVYANEIETDAMDETVSVEATNDQKPSLAKGKLSRWFQNEDRGIWTAGDKRRVLEGDLAQKKDRGITVYIGDSNTDLACLLEVDVGICVRDNPMMGEQKGLNDTLRRLNIPCRRISDLPDLESLQINNRQDEQILWWAKDFHEIAESALFRHV